MSTPFLKQVAKKYIAGDDPSAISKLCLVFPNRRSIAFFRKYLAEAVKERSAKPVVLPYLVTINDFFEKLSGKTIGGKVTLLLDLYDSYKALAPKPEPLDEFIFWGDVILGDFEDIDKYLVNARDLLTNVSDLREIDGGFDYLSENQKKAMERFLDHFNPSKRKTSSSLKGRDNVKESFATMWSLLLPLYESFKEKLAAKDAAYTGMAYRAVAERLAEESAIDILNPVYPHAEKFVFVGLNALSESEKVFMTSMKKAGLADFCWDYVGELIKDRGNCSSRFMEENIARFGQSLDIEEESGRGFKASVLKVPSATGQVKHIPQLIKGLDPGNTAIVLPDESLLPSLLNTIPEEIEDINVTMGYPITASEFHSFISDVIALQIHLRKYADGHVAFYHKQVRSIFASGTIRQVAAHEEDGTLASIIGRIKEEAKYYIPKEDFKGHSLLEAIFDPVISDLPAPSSESSEKLCAYLKRIITLVAPSIKKSQRSCLELDFAKRYYNDINKLEGYRLEITPATFARLLAEVAGVESVPFEGEPLRGLQIMGPLETRALDFENVIILSMNEGTFPSHNVSSSFIPPELRKGFGLPTYELQDSVWAYYFYRLTTRARTLKMVYDTRTEGVETGEESRYIKQLRYLYNIPLDEMTSGASICKREDKEPSLSKTDEDMKAISSLRFSPSAFKTLAECPLEFCYKYVKKLKAPGEVKENLDGGTSGTVFHALAQSLYHSEEAVMSPEPTEIYMESHPKGNEYITREYLKGWLARKDDIRRKAEVEIRYIMNVSEIRGKDLLMEEVIMKYVEKLLESDIRILEDNQKTRFHILSLERDYKGVTIGGFPFHGIIDRLDTFDDGTIRVVDYKTGGDDSATIASSANYADKDKAKELVDGTDKDHYKHAALLQFYLYDRFVMNEYGISADLIRNTMYSAGDMFTKTPVISPVDPSFIPTMDSTVEAKLAGLRDQGEPFVAGACRTASYKEEENCKYCDFKKICGR